MPFCRTWRTLVWRRQNYQLCCTQTRRHGSCGYASHVMFCNVTNYNIILIMHRICTFETLSTSQFFRFRAGSRWHKGYITIFKFMSKNSQEHLEFLRLRQVKGLRQRLYAAIATGWDENLHWDKRKCHKAIYRARDIMTLNGNALWTKTSLEDDSDIGYYIVLKQSRWVMNHGAQTGQRHCRLVWTRETTTCQHDVIINTCDYSSFTCIC